MDEVSHLSALGVDYGAMTLDIDKLRSHIERVIAKLNGRLAAMAKMRKVTTVRGYSRFVGAKHLEVEETCRTSQRKTGTKKIVVFRKDIIAAD